MSKIIYIVFLYCTFSYGQVFEEQFSQWWFDGNGNAGVVGDYRFDSTTGKGLIYDWSGNGNTLTSPATFDTTNQDSGYGFLNENGNSLMFVDVGDYFISSSNDFDMGYNDFSYAIFYVAAPQAGTYRTILTKDTVGVAHGGFRYNSYNTVTRAYFHSVSNANVYETDLETPNQPNGILTNYDRSANVNTYFLRRGKNATTLDISAYSTDSLWTKVQLAIGANHYNMTDYNTSLTSFLIQVLINRSLWTDRDIAEAWMLATGWDSYNGVVSRDNDSTYYQTFADTIKHVVGIDSTISASDKQWQASIYGKGINANKTLYIAIGSDFATQKGSGNTTLTTNFTTKTITLGNFNILSTDSIFIWSASANDTLKIDSVVVTEATTSSATTTRKRNFGGWATSGDWLK